MADKLNVNLFNSVTPFAYQWILGDDIYEFLAEYPDFLNDEYYILPLKEIAVDYWGSTGQSLVEEGTFIWYFSLQAMEQPEAVGSAEPIYSNKLTYYYNSTWENLTLNQAFVDTYCVVAAPYSVDQWAAFDAWKENIYIIYKKKPQLRGRKKSTKKVSEPQGTLVSDIKNSSNK